MSILNTLCRNKSLIWQLARHKLREQYVATWIGSLWAVLQPAMTLLVFWFVFTYGFKAGATTENTLPQFLILFTGLIPWMAFSEAMQGGTQSIVSQPYLVKKIVFPLEILPIVSLLSALIIHLVMLAFLLTILCFYGVWPSLSTLAIFYYLIGWLLFTAGLTWLLSALNVFHRDVGQTLSLFLMLWFWLTPIVWPLDNLPLQWQSYAYLNPIVYIVEGYRNTLLYGNPIANDWGNMLYFWSITLSLLALGLSFFKRVKFQFCDVI